jgi:predicted branched-subunit amino acid permease
MTSTVLPPARPTGTIPASASSSGSSSGPAASTLTPSRAAVHDLLAMLPSVGPFGLALGATASSMHVSPAATVVGAGLVYAGSAQLTVTTQLSAGMDLVAALAAGVLVNSRLLLYGAGLEPRFRQQSLRFRLLAAHFVIDPTYLAATARSDLDDDGFRRYWLRLGYGLLALWTGAVAAGALIGPALPRLPHLGLVAVAMFAAMVVPRLSDPQAAAATVVAGGIALLALVALPCLAVPLGAVAGIAAGTLLRPRRSGSSS